MNKGTGIAFGFLLVLAVVALGFYVAYSSFQSSRAALLFAPTRAPRTSTPTARPTTAATSTPTLIPTPLPGVTPTLTATIQSGPTATAQGGKPTRTPKPGPTTTSPPPTATVPSAGSFAFRLAGPPSPDPVGGCCYIRGTVRDAAGNGLSDVQLQLSDDWGNVYTASTKGGAEAGQYNFPISFQVLRYTVKVVDAQGTAISTGAVVGFDPAVAPAFTVDWRRTH